MPAAGKRSSLAPGAAQGEQRLSWRDQIVAWRNRLLADSRFQRWAASFPLTRKIAQKRAKTLFDLCAGFVYSQILFACVELRLFEILAERPHSIAELSRRTSLSQRAAARLLNAAIALGLVERNSGGQFLLGVHGAAFLGNPALAAMVKHHALLYADLRDPVALLRGDQQRTALARYWPYACAESPDTLRHEDVRDYTALMSSSQALIADDILEAWPLTRHRCLLDVGGGDGAFIAAAAARFPDLRLMLFDLPAVGQLAAARVAAAGLSHRVSVSSGDFFKEPLPRGADIVSLVRVMHDHDDADLVALLRNIRRALPMDGVLLIAEPMSGIADAAEIGDAYFGFYLLAMGSGRARSPEEIARLLRETGFDAGRELKTRRPMLTRAMIFRPVE